MIARVVEPLPAFGMISVGFPGVVKRTHIATAPNLGTQYWKDFDLEQALTRQFGKPVRILNDAIVYGLGIARGPGRECVLTFGTGMGCAPFSAKDRHFTDRKLGQHYACDGMNYDQYIGHAAYLAIGLEEWNKRAERCPRCCSWTDQQRPHLHRRRKFPAHHLPHCLLGLRLCRPQGAWRAARGFGTQRWISGSPPGKTSSRLSGGSHERPHHRRRNAGHDRHDRQR